MKNYELSYLISPEASEQNVESLQEKIKSLIQQGTGSVGKVNRATKIRLAYPIKEQREVFWTNLTFALEPEKLKNIEQGLKAEKQILRYLILVKKLLKKTSRIRTKPKIELKPKTKVELKDIEKKLEEILGEQPSNDESQ
ncbi:MAG: 30S ribosomal protein S6 [Patescibacteria group bacterium]|nr:30S ribosomal protein S6 [Patescibacteria group bacterium]